jgi:hypothetical protein
MADGYYTFDGDHHANLGHGGAERLCLGGGLAPIFNQAMLAGESGSAPRLALDGAICGARSLRLTACASSIPLRARGQYLFGEFAARQMGDVITVPEFTDASDWPPWPIRAWRRASSCRTLRPAAQIYVSDRETSGRCSPNDEIRMKVAIGVQSSWPLSSALQGQCGRLAGCQGGE